jgi:hypothetical protein
MNLLELRLRELPREEAPIRYLAELYADGQLVAPDRRFDDFLTIDLVALTQAALSDGGYFILTCSCGDAGCGGIDQPVAATHAGGLSTWRFDSLGGDPVLQFDRLAFTQQVLGSLLKFRKHLSGDIPHGEFPIGPAGFDSVYLDWCIDNLRAGCLLTDPYSRFQSR